MCLEQARPETWPELVTPVLRLGHVRKAPCDPGPNIPGQSAGPSSPQKRGGRKKRAPFPCWLIVKGHPPPPPNKKHLG